MCVVMYIMYFLFSQAATNNRMHFCFLAEGKKAICMLKETLLTMTSVLDKIGHLLNRPSSGISNIEYLWAFSFILPMGYTRKHISILEIFWLVVLTLNDLPNRFGHQYSTAHQQLSIFQMAKQTQQNVT